MKLDVTGNVRKEFFGGILYNKYGKLIYLNKKEYQICENIIMNKSHNLSFSELNYYIKKGLLTITNQQNNHILIKNSVVNKNILSAPISAHFYPTYKCNQKCFFCYNPENNHENNNEILNNTKKVINILAENGVIIFNVLGGEPLLNFDYLIETLNYASEKMFCSFASNGTANGGITEEKAQKLSQIKNIDIRISMHGYNSETHDSIVGIKGAFDNAINSIKNLVKYGVSCRMSCVPTKLNYKDINKMVELAYELGMSGFHLLPSHMTESYDINHKMWLNYDKQMEIIEGLKVIKFKNHFEISYLNWYENVKNYIFKYDGQSLCVAGKEIIEIDPLGDIYPCSMVLGNKDFVCGNILYEKFNDIWNSKKFNIIRQRTPEKIFNNNCKICKHLSKCIGGCPMSNYLISKNINYGDILCPLCKNK